MKKQKMSTSDFIKTFKWHIVLWIIGLIVLANFIYKKVTAPNYLLNGIMLSAEGGEEAATKLADELIEIAGYEDTVYGINFDTEYSYIPDDDDNAENNYKATEAIVSQSNEEMLDFVTGPIDSMLDIAYNTVFTELTTYLTKDQLALVEPYLLYIDQTVMEELSEAYENDEDISAIALPDPTKPEEMEEPVAVLIDIRDFDKLMDIYGNSEDFFALGIMGNAPNEDIIVKFLNYVMKEQNQ